MKYDLHDKSPLDGTLFEIGLVLVVEYLYPFLRLRLFLSAVSVNFVFQLSDCFEGKTDNKCSAEHYGF